MNRARVDQGIPRTIREIAVRVAPDPTTKTRIRF